MNTHYEHVPVLLEEVLFYLQPEPGKNFVDATLGGGGYTAALALKNKPRGKVLAIDLDTDAVKNFESVIKQQKFGERVRAVQGNFQDLDKIVRKEKFADISGIVADLGLSSYELDQAGRGISFQRHEPLDMRFNATGNTETAAYILNNYTEQELLDIVKKYGEEPFARLIVRGVLRERAQRNLTHTTDLVRIVKSSIPRRVAHKATESLRRVFQALRIAVNNELNNLEEFLPKALDLLNPGGRLVVVSFHSLEDRIVKQFFEAASKGCVCPPEFPICVCGRNPAAKILTKKPITASLQELKQNPRSKPAKLRALQKY